MEKSATNPAFVADSSLGRLAKQLRLAGFDTLIDPHPPNADRLSRLSGPNRIVLTRSTKVRRALVSQPLMFIDHDQPLAQARQVMAQLHIKRRDLHPFTRCIQCNQLLVGLMREEAFGRVPEYVWQQHRVFKTCAQCRRIYWPGSHTQRWLERMTSWFESSHELGT
ncbi:MAG: hypothetical protein M0036_22305 [Desulfobacteraceae bacterium]|nr:hypothetical protein [Desulfobacteraceae bacterium]